MPDRVRTEPGASTVSRRTLLVGAAAAAATTVTGCGGGSLPVAEAPPHQSGRAYRGRPLELSY